MLTSEFIVAKGYPLIRVGSLLCLTGMRLILILAFGIVIKGRVSRAEAIKAVLRS